MKRIPHGRDKVELGTFSELLAAAWFTQQGFQTFKALSPGATCDLLVFKDKGNAKIWRIEVKSTKKFGPLAPITNNPGRHQIRRFDVLASVNQRGKVRCYKPVLALVSLKRGGTKTQLTWQRVYPPRFEFKIGQDS